MRTSPQKTAGELAIRYLSGYWEQRYHQSAPLDLVESVVQSVNKLGYTRRIVDTLVQAYERRQKEGK